MDMTDNKRNQRGQFPILVLDAHERMSVAVIRSLGRAGYPVHACSPFCYATGLHSSFAAQTAICPHFTEETFVAWLRQYCADKEISCIVPTEPFLLAIREMFSEFSPVIPLSDTRETVYCGINKYELFESLGETFDTNHSSTNLPPLLLVQRRYGPPDDAKLEALGTPLFVKVDGYHSVAGEESATFVTATVEQTKRLVSDLLTRFEVLIIQGNVPSVGVGAFLLRWKGEWLGEFMHMRLHEIPVQGWSSYRRSWRHERILLDARNKLESLDWEGVAMMEYRWNPADDTFALIEMNGRFWGSLHLALYAGVDFPVLLLDAFTGIGTVSSTRALTNVYSRDIILDAKYVASRMKDSDLGLGGKCLVLANFLALMFDPSVKSDLFFPGDRWLFFWQCRQHLVSFMERLLR